MEIVLNNPSHTLRQLGRTNRHFTPFFALNKSIDRKATERKFHNHPRGKTMSSLWFCPFSYLLLQRFLEAYKRLSDWLCGTNILTWVRQNIFVGNFHVLMKRYQTTDAVIAVIILFKIDRLSRQWGALVENGEDICRKDLFWLPGRYQQGGWSHSYICLLRSA